MEPNIIDRIIYTQILNRAGFTVHEITQVHLTRGDSVDVAGRFERDGDAVTTVEIAARGDIIVIAEQEHHVTLRPGGGFDLFIAHCDGP